jgi:hypothetical protein
MPTFRKVGKRNKAKRNSPWKPEFVILAFEMCKAGASDTQIAKMMNVQDRTLRKWREKKPEFNHAFMKGRKSRQKENGCETFLEYVYGRLPEELQAIWNDIMAVSEHPNALKKVEFLLEGCGIRARQHLLLYALVHFNFDMAKALGSLNIPRGAFRDWVIADPEFADLMDHMHEYKKDFFEGALTGLVAQGDPNAIIFVNKTFNADRGYEDKKNVKIDAKHDINMDGKLTIDDLDVPLEVKKQVLEAYRQKKALAAGSRVVETTAKRITAITEDETDDDEV